MSIALVAWLGQISGTCWSEPQVPHLLLVSYIFTVKGVVVVAISLTFRWAAVLGCGAAVVL